MFHRLEFRVHSHATEEEAKVRQAFAFVTGVEEPEVDRTEGYHRNPILVLTARLETRADIAAFWERVQAEGQLDAFLRELDVRIDEDCILHARFDKQEAFQGRLRLASHDDVISLKGKVAAYPAKRSQALEAARAYLEEVGARS